MKNWEKDPAPTIYADIQPFLPTPGSASSLPKGPWTPTSYAYLPLP